MMVEAFEKLLLAGLAFDVSEDLRDIAGVGGSWALGAMSVELGCVNVTSSPPSYRESAGVTTPSRAYERGAKGGCW